MIGHVSSEQRVCWCLSLQWPFLSVMDASFLYELELRTVRIHPQTWVMMAPLLHAVICNLHMTFLSGGPHERE